MFQVLPEQFSNIARTWPLGGFTVITSTTGTGREGVDQRVFQLALRLAF